MVNTIHKYNFTGLRGPIIHIMSDCLTNRWQYSFDIERFSEKLSVVTGVPQDSIIGPLVFLFFF